MRNCPPSFLTLAPPQLSERRGRPSQDGAPAGRGAARPQRRPEELHEKNANAPACAAAGGRGGRQEGRWRRWEHGSGGDDDDDGAAHQRTAAVGGHRRRRDVVLPLHGALRRGGADRRRGGHLGGVRLQLARLHHLGAGPVAAVGRRGSAGRQRRVLEGEDEEEEGQAPGEPDGPCVQPGRLPGLSRGFAGALG